MTTYKLHYQISADGKQAKAELAEVERSIERLSGRGRSGGSGFADVLGGNLAADAITKFSGLLADGGRAVLDYSAKLEQTKISFQTLMGGAEQAAKHIEELRKLSTSTPLEFQSITKMSQRLQGAGVSAAKVTELIKDIGNTAAATGEMTAERMEGIGVAISQILSKGRLSAEEMEQLSERSIPAWRILSQQMGKSVEETRKLAEQGKISGDVMVEAFQKFSRANFGDAMKKQAETFTGAMNIITNIAMVTAEQAFKPIFEKISTFGADVARSLKEQQGTVENAGVSFGFALGEAIAAGVEQSGLNGYFSNFFENQFAGLKLLDTELENVRRGYLKGSDPFTRELRGFEREQRAYEDAMQRYRSLTAPKPATMPGGTTGKSKLGPSGDNRTDKQAYQDFVAELKKLGIAINSGYRTFAQQAALYRRLPKGQAARPGTSDHEFWRAVDLPPNVSDELLQLAAKRANVTLEKRFVHQGTGLHNHQAFRKGRKEGGGEADIIREAQELERLREEDLANLQRVLDEMVAEEKEASQERLAIRRAEAEVAVEIIEGQVQAGTMTEIEAVNRLGQLKLDMLIEERDEIADQISSRENINRIAVLNLAIDKQILANTRERAAAEKKRNDEKNQSWKKYIENLEKEQALLDENARKAAQSQAEAAMVSAPGTLGGGIARGLGIDLISVFDPDKVGVMKSSAQHIKEIWADVAGSVGESLGQLTQGLAQMGAAFLVTGEFSAKAALQMAAGAALGIATQAGFKAVFEYAEAAAAAARYDFYAAGMHTAAAKLYLKTAIIAGAVGVGLGLAGRAVGGGGSQGEGGQDEGSFGSSATTSNPQPYSRASGDAFISGRRSDPAVEQLARAVEKLEQKLGGMRPGDVLVAGAREKRGFIGYQVAQDIKTNAETGRMILRSAGVQ